MKSSKSLFMVIMMWIYMVSCDAGLYDESPGVPTCTDILGGRGSGLATSHEPMTMQGIDHGTMPSQVQDHSVSEKGGVGARLRGRGAWFTVWFFQAMTFGLGGPTWWTDPPP